jgi:predicted transposase/invertase (TIGR01784 family)
MSKDKRVLISFDYALKRLLRDKVNYDVLEGFLSELFKYDVKVKNIVESETNKQTAEDKYNRFDILIEDEKGELIVVELQFKIQADYFHRMAYGASKILVERVEEGQSYMVLRKVISINIVYFDLGYGDDYIYHCDAVFRGMHTGSELGLSIDQRDAYDKKMPAEIFPEFYIIKIGQFDDKVKDKFDEWIYFFKHNSVKDEFTAKGLEKVRKILLYDNLTLKEKMEYNDIQYDRRQSLNSLASAENRGKVEGKVEGREEGKEEARQKYEPIIAEKDAALAREREEKEIANAALAREREEKEMANAALAREREEKETANAVLARALAELEAFKNKGNNN